MMTRMVIGGNDGSSNSTGNSKGSSGSKSKSNDIKVT